MILTDFDSNQKDKSISWESIEQPVITINRCDLSSKTTIDGSVALRGQPVCSGNE